MALIATFAGTTHFYNNGVASPNYFQVQLLVYLNSQSIGNNTSNITLVLQVRSVNSGYMSYGYVQTPIIQGVGGAGVTYDTRATNVWQTFGSRTFDIGHNSDGTFTLSASASFTTNETSGNYGLKDGAVGGSVALTTIPRAALLNSFADFQIETTAGAINGNLTIYSASFSHYVQLFKNGVERANWTIAAGPVGSYNYALTLTAAQRNAIFGQMPSSESDVFTLVVSTFNGSTQIGSSQSRTATGAIPTGYKPSITTANSNFSWLNKNDPPALRGYLIQNVSTLTLLLSGGSAPTGASLSMYQVRFGTVTRQGGYSGAAISENVGLIAGSGTLYAYYSVKDSRERWSDEISEALTVQAYNPPVNNGFKVQRNGSVATLADFVLKFANSLYSLGNTWNYTPYYWTGAYWQACKAATAIAAASIDSLYTHSLPYSESLVYNLKVVLTDLFNSVEYTDVLPTSAFPLSFGKKGCGFGKDTSDTYNIEAGALGISSDGGYAVTDTRNKVPITNIGPFAKFEMKANTSDGLANGGNYHSTITIQPWGDPSGGSIHQIGFTDGDQIFCRSAIIDGVWNKWKKITTDIRKGRQAKEIGLSIAAGNTSWIDVVSVSIPQYTACMLELVMGGIQQGSGSFGMRKVWFISRESLGITIILVTNDAWGAVAGQNANVIYNLTADQVFIYAKSSNSSGCTYIGEAVAIGSFDAIG